MNVKLNKLAIESLLNLNYSASYLLFIEDKPTTRRDQQS
jgi:hypothetical protein